jgi:hypothetical protein
VKRLLVVALLAVPQATAAQAVSQRGFVDVSGVYFPQDAPNDRVNAVGDLLAREEIFVTPTPWLQFAAGVDVRANTHGQVDPTWRIDFLDRSRLRPAFAIRRLAATISHGRFTVDAGKQFVRWGKTDIVTPTDWLAPRDYMNVIDNEFLPVLGVRGVARFGSDSLEAVWVPALTPSRIPLTTQRWTSAPPDTQVVEAGAVIPEGSQTGVRWSHIGSRLEYSLAFFDGFNHLPNFQPVLPIVPPVVTIIPYYPSLRSYGSDIVVPTRWMTIKGEAAYFTTSTPATDEYILYVVQVERQIGEWALVGGYAGEHVTNQQSQLTFAPDRGLTKAIVGRGSYTIDVNRSAAIEGAVRQNGAGAYLKVEYSQAFVKHWRTTVSGSLIRGQPDDFIGQYHLNSHVMVAVRYSF